ncbi:MAG: polysaccharide biosynthesis tyrosine autokinase [Chloroflexaceae bacterium]|nr:polysaccharide biosynthesis tyrosine autokinase [Chloroflexaceae bacterium]
MEIKHTIRFLTRWLWLIALCAVLAGGVAFAIAQRQGRTYSATTTLLVNPGRPSREGLDLGNADEREYIVQTYISLLNKRPVFEHVIATLDLDASPGRLADNVSIVSVANTQMIEVQVKDGDPRRAAVIANAIVQAFNELEPTLLANPYAANRPGLHIVEVAIPPDQPDSIGAVPIATLAFVVGALIAVGAAFLLEYLDSSVRSYKDIERLTGLHTVTVIGRIRGAGPFSKLVTLKKPHSLAAETYRMVRAHIELAAEERPVQAITVTSSNTGEGKSVTAANLAVALAQTGLRVIVVDGNLRKPALHRFFQQPNERGLSTLLEQHPDSPEVIEEFLLPIAENLHLLPGGPVSTHPAQLLAKQRLHWLVNELKHHADIVLFDSAALLDVLDTLSLVRVSDTTLLVVLAGKTQGSTLVRACEYLRQSQAHVLGALLNRVALFDLDRNNYGRLSLGTGRQAAEREQPEHDLPHRLLNRMNGASPTGATAQKFNIVDRRDRA